MKRKDVLLSTNYKRPQEEKEGGIFPKGLTKW